MMEQSPPFLGIYRPTLTQLIYFELNPFVPVHDLNNVRFTGTNGLKDVTNQVTWELARTKTLSRANHGGQNIKHIK